MFFGRWLGLVDNGEPPNAASPQGLEVGKRQQRKCHMQAARKSSPVRVSDYWSYVNTIIQLSLSLSVLTAIFQVNLG